MPIRMPSWWKTARVSETIIRGRLVTLLKPSNRNATRVIVSWREQEWLMSLSAWEAAEPQWRTFTKAKSFSVYQLNTRGLELFGYEQIGTAVLFTSAGSRPTVKP